MIIFIPLFLVLFVAVPLLLTHWACQLFGVRGLVGRLTVFAFIAWANWQMWQAPPEKLHPEMYPQAASASVPAR